MQSEWPSHRIFRFGNHTGFCVEAVLSPVSVYQLSIFRKVLRRDYVNLMGNRIELQYAIHTGQTQATIPPPFCSKHFLYAEIIGITVLR